MSGRNGVKRRLDEAFDNAEESTKKKETVVAVRAVEGFLDEGEEVKSCPLCEKPLVWFCFRKDMEIQGCSDPVCVYPFVGSSTEGYVVRQRVTANQLEIEGNGELALANQKSKDNDAKEPGAMMPYENDRREKFRKVAQQQLENFINTPKHLRAPDKYESRRHDVAAVQVLINSIDEEERRKLLELESLD